MGTKKDYISLKGAKALILEDDPGFHVLIGEILKPYGVECEYVLNGAEAIELAKKNSYHAAVIDIFLPGKLGGFKVAKELKKIKKEFPIIIITGKLDLESAINAIRVGAIDFIPKPINEKDFLEALEKGVKVGRRERVIEGFLGESGGNINYEDLTETQKFSLSASVFVEVMEDNVRYFKNWSRKIMESCLRVARKMNMPEKSLSSLRAAALIHDLGNLKNEIMVLEKPEKLTEEEKDMLKLHPEASAEISTRLNRNREEIQMIRHHHERYDGTGYPDGLKGEDIPIGSRILAVADAYVAMRSERPYRGALSHEDAVSELRRNSGSQFDGKVVEIFIETIQHDDNG